MANGKTKKVGFVTPEKPSLRVGRSWFFGIGIDRYQHFSNLNNAVKDAKDLSALLQEQYDLHQEHIITLFNEEATRHNIIRVFDRLLREVKSEDKLLIYYSGHGHLLEAGKNKKGFWIPTDAEKDSTSQYIRNNTVREYIEDIDSRHTLLISDSCFSGSLFVRGVSRAETAIEELEQRPSRWAICSGRHDEEVSDGEPGTNSPFADSILDILRSNKRAKLNVAKLADQVVELTRANYKQLPEGNPLYGVGHKGGQYVFHRKADEAGDWKACKEAGTAAACRAFLANYPEGMYTEAAKTTLARLEEEAAWEEAQTKGTILSYFEYNQSYSNGKYRAQALVAIKKLEEEQSWQQAQRFNTLSAFLDYQGRYPQGRYAAEAETQIQSLLAQQQEPAAWRAAQGKGTIESYEAFLQKYPKSLHAREAREAIQKLEQESQEVKWSIEEEKKRLWEKAAAEEYRRKEAQQKELTAWQAAQKIGTIESYDAFQQQYPQSQHVSEARTVIQQLKQLELEKNNRQEAQQAVKTKPEPSRDLFQTANQLGKSFDWEKWGPAVGGVVVIVVLIAWGISRVLLTDTVTLGGQTYKTVTLNGKIWMAENLNYGVPDSWCYDNDQTNCKKYGRLYTWEAGKKACQAVGWRLPTDTEWRELAKLYGGVGDDNIAHGGKAAYEELLKGGKSRFAALLGGKWDPTTSSYQGLKWYGGYWSGTENGKGEVWGYNFRSHNENFYRSSAIKSYGRSCRCIQD